MENKDKIKFILIFFLLLVLLFLLFSVIFLISKPEESGVSPQLSEDGRTTGRQPEGVEKNISGDKELTKAQKKRIDNVQKYEKALAGEDDKYCLDISDSYTKDQCFKALAKKKYKPQLCENIEQESIKRSCLYSVYFYKALEANDEEVCYGLNDKAVAEKCAQRAKERNFCLTEECYVDYINGRQQENN